MWEGLQPRRIARERLAKQQPHDKKAALRPLLVFAFAFPGSGSRLYRNPVSLRAITRRWISLVPS